MALSIALDPDARRIWELSPRAECPGVTVGHFENADRLSYEVLLAPHRTG
jgi:hypothetical protein